MVIACALPTLHCPLHTAIIRRRVSGTQYPLCLRKQASITPAMAIPSILFIDAVAVG